MFTEHFGLRFNPFDKAHLTGKDAFESQDFRFMIQRLKVILPSGGIAVITSPPGMGKTYAVRSFSDSLSTSRYLVAYTALSTVGTNEFYAALCEIFGLEPSWRKSRMYKTLRDFLFTQYSAKKQPVVLILDEAHHLSAAILQELKMLTNIHMDAVNAFTLVLLGEPMLNETLSKPVHEALRQRITVHYNCTGLSEAETKDYLVSKLERAGGGDWLVEEEAVRLIHSNSRGNPRVIDQMMTYALTIGASKREQTIVPQTILDAVENIRLI